MNDVSLDWHRQFGKLEMLEMFFGFDKKTYIMYKYFYNDSIAYSIAYLIAHTQESIGYNDSTKYLTKEEAEEKKKNIIDGTEDDTKESKFEEEIISEDIFYMPADEFNEGYYYNTITGKKIEK